MKSDAPTTSIGTFISVAARAPMALVRRFFPAAPDAMGRVLKPGLFTVAFAVAVAAPVSGAPETAAAAFENAGGAENTSGRTDAAGAGGSAAIGNAGGAENTSGRTDATGAGGSAAIEKAGGAENTSGRMDAAGAGGNTVIEFKPGVLVMTPTYRLEDVAALAHPDPGLRDRLLAIELGRAPRPGQFTQVTRRGVIARIERELPGAAARVDWKGKAFVRVQGGGVAGDGAAIERSAHRRLIAWLRRHYSEKSPVPETAAVVSAHRDGGKSSMHSAGDKKEATSGDVDKNSMRGDGDGDENSTQNASGKNAALIPVTSIELRRVGGRDALVIPRGPVSYHPRIGARRPGKRMVVWVDVRVGGRLFQTVPVWFAVSIFAPVAVVGETVEKHRALPVDKVAVTPCDIAGLDGTPVPVQDLTRALAGKRAARRLPAGAVVTVADVEPIPPVSRGDWITVYATEGTVALAVRARALGDAELNQPIRVENPGSGEFYRARVIGRGLARVD